MGLMYIEHGGGIVIVVVHQVYFETVVSSGYPIYRGDFAEIFKN